VSARQLSLPDLPQVSFSDLPSPNEVADRVAEETGGVATEAVRAFLGLPGDVRDAVVSTPEKRKLPPTSEGGKLIRKVRSTRARGLRFLATPLRSAIVAAEEAVETAKKKDRVDRGRP
jgi:hypothetical protein